MLLDLGTYVVKEPSILYVQLPAHKRDALRYSFSNTAHEMKPRNGFYYPCSGRKVWGGIENNRGVFPGLEKLPCRDKLDVHNLLST